MKFVKGQKLNIGNKFRLGKTPWNKGKKGLQAAWNKGGHLAEATKQKLREFNLKNGIKPPSRKGKTTSPQHKEMMKERFMGSKNPNWKGGITPLNTIIRTSAEYKLWRKAVFERDNYYCIWGGKEHGNELHADHIKPFSLFPELRFAIDNGRTLCVNCHRKTDTYAGKLKKYKTL